jgi:TIR domain
MLPDKELHNFQRNWAATTEDEVRRRLATARRHVEDILITKLAKGPNENFGELSGVVSDELLAQTRKLALVLWDLASRIASANATSGNGFPEPGDLIHAFELLNTHAAITPVDNGSVFISYSRKNKDVLAELEGHLKQANVHYWFDREIKKGERWADDIIRHLRNCRALHINSNAL